MRLSVSATSEKAIAGWGLRAIAVAEVSVSGPSGAGGAGIDLDFGHRRASTRTLGDRWTRFWSRRSQMSGVAPQSQRDLELCSSASRVVPASGTAKGTAPS